MGVYRPESYRRATSRARQPQPVAALSSGAPHARLAVSAGRPLAKLPAASSCRAAAAASSSRGRDHGRSIDPSRAVGQKKGGTSRAWPRVETSSSCPPLPCYQTAAAQQRRDAAAPIPGFCAHPSPPGIAHSEQRQIPSPGISSQQTSPALVDKQANPTTDASSQAKQSQRPATDAQQNGQRTNNTQTQPRLRPPSHAVSSSRFYWPPSRHEGLLSLHRLGAAGEDTRRHGRRRVAGPAYAAARVSPSCQSVPLPAPCLGARCSYARHVWTHAVSTDSDVHLLPLHAVPTSSPPSRPSPASESPAVLGLVFPPATAVHVEIGTSYK
ncbi:hypothetical protein CDD83_1078 [Cordyceps sp. RAO-2017]|nr:hypothetical protein CDD83_1078 [Cordyceps sp. RAO-2017]